MKLEEGGKERRGLERKVERLEKDGGKIGEKGKESRRLEGRVRKLEMWKGRSRKKRRKRVVIKGYKTSEKNVKRKVENILKKVGAEVGVEDVREMKTGQ